MVDESKTLTCESVLPDLPAGDCEPVIGEYYSAIKGTNGWRNESRRAEVIARRLNTLSNAVEYFVHFDGGILSRTLPPESFTFSSSDDRRMDVWLPTDAIDFTKRRTNESPEVKRGEAALENIQGAVTRSKRVRLEERDAYAYYGMDPETYALEKQREEMTRIKHISAIHFGSCRIETWYYSPYPGKYGMSPRLFVCDVCFKYMRSLKSYRRHRSTIHDNIPGRELYRQDNLSIIEVDGEDRGNEKSWIYCQNLCLLSKVFLDHKTVCYDVEPFLFYVLYEWNDNERHAAGYFSKEKWPSDDNNLSCITVFPPYQRKGYGSFLIQFSYMISAGEGVLGGPERPLSDFGRISYRTFWTWKIVQVLQQYLGCSMTIRGISRSTGLLQSDVLETLRTLRIPHFFKGQKVVRFTERLLTFCVTSKYYRIPSLIVDPKYLLAAPVTKSKESKKRRASSQHSMDNMC
ncbi:hypothetical protein M514_05956 [Trichuris suis]|uniref:Histone acetyltransferase n=1 Tax=Trichuris suis TaxID=68888 RepID=A0A085N7U5_9BILA|nr:hypothetical protein M514_05956 [Trichuris suis]